MVIQLSKANQLSLYIHIPFCKRKCDYCNFYVIPDKEQHKVLLLEALKLEWERVLIEIEQSKCVLSSIYFGGGTPSLFGPERVSTVIDWIRQYSSQPVETTLEMNPEGVTPSLISQYKDAGINRVSMGVQSFDDHELQLLTRRHGARRARVAVEQVYQAGITNISIDLMYDLPQQTEESWERTLRQATLLPITHLSLYNLTIEPHTVFHKYKNRLLPTLPSENVSYNMYSNAIKMLKEAGFEQYEISAFAKENLHSVHNTGYWTGRPFIGLGPSAYSFWKGKRYRNAANINKYSQALQDHRSPVDFSDELSEEERKNELLVVALRLISGVDTSNFEALYGALSRTTKQTLQALIDKKLLVSEGSRVSLTKRGVMFYDTVATELI